MYPICRIEAAIATPVAMKISLTLYATKKRMTGKKSKRNFKRKVFFRRKA
jgi:hypothetical protein